MRTCFPPREPVATPSEIDPACGGDPQSSVASGSRVEPNTGTRDLDWEVNGKEQLGVAWGVVFHNEEVKYNARGNRQRIPRKCPGLAAVACGPRPETKNKSFVHAYHAFFRSYTKIVLYLVHSLAVFITPY